MPIAGGYGKAEVEALIAVHKAIADAHHAKVHGTAEHTNVTRELFIPANEGFIDGGTPGSSDSYGLVYGSANDLIKVYFTIKVPDDFVSFTKVEAVWTAVGVPGKNMYWQLAAHYAASGEVRGTHSDLPALGVTANGGGLIFNVQEPANPLTLANLAKGDYLGIKFYRDGGNPLDTIDKAVQLYGLLFTYTAEQ